MVDLPHVSSCSSHPAQHVGFRSKLPISNGELCSQVYHLPQEILTLTCTHTQCHPLWLQATRPPCFLAPESLICGNLLVLCCSNTNLMLKLPTCIAHITDTATRMRIRSERTWLSTGFVWVLFRARLLVPGFLRRPSAVTQHAGANAARYRWPCCRNRARALSTCRL